MKIPSNPDQFFFSGGLTLARREEILAWVKTLDANQLQMIEELIQNESLEESYANDPDA